MKKLLAALTFCCFAIISCSNTPSENKNPVTVPTPTPYKSSHVTDTAGSPLSGVKVSMHLLFNGDVPSTPKISVTNSYTVDVRIHLFDMFDKQINSLSSSYTCDDNMPPHCTGSATPRWDHTDFNGDTVPPGLYYAYSASYWHEQNMYDSSGVKIWMYLEGFIDSSDANGAYQIPPVPVNQNINFTINGTLVRTFNGWLRLTFEKTNYITADDTCFFGDSTIPAIVLKHQ